MLKRHRRRHLHPRKQNPVSSQHAAARHLSPIALPGLHPTIPHNWEYIQNQDYVLDLALQFTNANVLHDRHFPTGRSLMDAIRYAVSELGTTARPRPLANLTIGIGLDEQTLEWNCERYAAERKCPLDCTIAENLRGLAIIMNSAEGMHDEVIGPALQALEAWPGVGRTVLRILEKGLQKTTRCLSIGNGIEWASCQYWRGEENEKDIVQEHLEDERDYLIQQFKEKHPNQPTPTDAELIRDNINIFTRAEFEAHIPRQWHHVGRMPLKKLPHELGEPTENPAWSFPPNTPLHVSINPIDRVDVEQMRQRWPSILTACENIQDLMRLDCDDDSKFCHDGWSWVAQPFMLRMSKHDALPRIADDAWEETMQTGDSLEINSIFLWHDLPTMKKALKRLTNFLSLTQACEDLIPLLRLEPQEVPIRIQV